MCYGRMTLVAVNRVDGDVGGELDSSRVGLSLTTVIMGDAKVVFALPRTQEDGRQGRSGSLFKYLSRRRGSDMMGMWGYPCRSSGPGDQMDVPRLRTGLEFVPR